MDLDCLRLVLLVTDAETLFQLLRSFEVPTHVLIICSCDYFWKSKLQTDFGIICNLSIDHNYETCKRLYSLIMNKSYGFIWHLSCSMKWWNYARAIISMTSFKILANISSGSNNHKYQSISNTKYISTIIERQKNGLDSFCISHDHAVFSRCDWILNLMKHGPSNIIISVFKKICYLQTSALDSKDFRYLLVALLASDRLDAFQLINHEISCDKADLAEFAVGYGIINGSEKILSFLLPKSHIIIPDLESAIDYARVEILKMLLESLKDPDEISKLPNLLGYAVQKAKVSAEIVRVLLSDSRTHSADILRGCLLLASSSSDREIMDLLKPYVDDGNEIVQSIHDPMRMIECLEYLRLGFGFIAIALGIATVYKGWAKN